MLNQTENYSSEMRSIENMHSKDMAAAKKLDIATLLSLWTDDGVLLQPGQEALIGKEAIWNYMQEQSEKEQVLKIIDYIHEFEEIRILNNWAYEWGTFKGSYRPIAGGKVIHQRARLFRVLQKQTDGTWKCARAIWHDLPALSTE